MGLMLVVLVDVSIGQVPTAFNQRQIVDIHDVQKAMLAVCMKEAGILSCAVNVTNANIEITIQRTGDNDTFHKALESIIGNYAWFAVKSTYDGDLRIILDNSQGKMIDEWNTTASDAIAHVQDETIGTGWVESIINASHGVKTITLGHEKALSDTDIVSAKDYLVTAGNWNLGAQTTSSVSNSQPLQSAPITYTRQATGTREDPIPMSTTVDLGDGWQVAVMSVIPDATNVVLQENPYNSPPKAGNQFFLARVQAKYNGASSATFGGSYRLRAVGPSSVGYSTFANSPGVIPDPLPDSEVFSGGIIEGNIGWEIKSSDAGSLVMYDNPISFGGNSDRVYMALYGGPMGSTGPSASTFNNDREWANKGTGKMGRY